MVLLAGMVGWATPPFISNLPEIKENNYQMQILFSYTRPYFLTSKTPDLSLWLFGVSFSSGEAEALGRKARVTQ